MSIERVSLVMPYYDNPGMLEIHYETLAHFPDEIKDRIELIIVDDGSPVTPAATVKRPDGLPRTKIFRVAVDMPWHQHAARNIGAHEARHDWLMLTDIDHLLPLQSWKDIFAIEPPIAVQDVFTFTRYEADTGKRKIKNGNEHPHPNTFLMRKDFFWSVGGYDEDYCGVYGTDGMWRKRLWGVAKQKHLKTKIIRYMREVQPDASTTTLPRKEGRDPMAKPRIEQMKREKGTVGVPTVLSMPYTRAYPHKLPDWRKEEMENVEDRHV